LTIEEAKKLPMWPEMNRYIKEILSKEMGDIEFDIVTFEDHWEVQVDGLTVADIGITVVDDHKLQDGSKLN
jgi:hypothetical protein